jgi:hypothetical protein
VLELRRRSGRQMERAGTASARCRAGVGLGYCLLKMVAIAGRWFGADFDVWSSLVAPASASAGALFVAGFSLPALGARLAAYRSYRRRYPLWYDLATPFPEMVLDPPSWSWRERWLPRGCVFGWSVRSLKSATADWLSCRILMTVLP